MQLGRNEVRESCSRKLYKFILEIIECRVGEIVQIELFSVSRVLFLFFVTK